MQSRHNRPAERGVNGSRSTQLGETKLPFRRSTLEPQTCSWREASDADSCGMVRSKSSSVCLQSLLHCWKLSLPISQSTKGLIDHEDVVGGQHTFKIDARNAECWACCYQDGLVQAASTCNSVSEICISTFAWSNEGHLSTVWYATDAWYTLMMTHIAYMI